MLRKSIIAAALVALVSAVQERTTKPLADPWVWTITNFGGGCSPATCTFEFNITAPDYLSIKGFNAECSGNTLQNNDNYVYCDQPDSSVAVSAKIGGLTTVDGQNKMKTYITYKYVTPVLPNIAASYNFTAEGAGKYDGRANPGSTDSFTVSPTDVILEKVLV